LEQPGAFVMTVAYRDKYGLLGKIAVLQGRAACGRIEVRTWVMSCRAFARRIEHRCLELLWERFEAEEILFSFRPTPKNAPLQEFFAGFLGDAPAGDFHLTRAAFRQKCPALFHLVES